MSASPAWLGCEFLGPRHIWLERSAWTHRLWCHQTRRTKNGHSTAARPENIHPRKSLTNTSIAWHNSERSTLDHGWWFRPLKNCDWLLSSEWSEISEVESMQSTTYAEFLAHFHIGLSQGSSRPLQSARGADPERASWVIRFPKKVRSEYKELPGISRIAHTTWVVLTFPLFPGKDRSQGREKT